jgi:ABC-type sugar transport system, periplasmic component
MKRNKRIAFFAGLLALMLILAGCGGSSNGKSGNGGNSGNTSGNTAPSGDKVKISVWAMGDEAKSLPTVAEEFMKEHPNIVVDVQALPWSNAHDKLLTAVASKSGPDVVQMGTTWMAEFANAGALKDLTPYVDQYPEFASDQFYEGAVGTTKFGDKIYGIPWYTETRFLYYRSDLLAEAGYPEAPKTWEELRDAAKKLADRGEGKYGLSIDMNEQSLTFMFARQNGSALLGEDGKPLFNQPEFKEAVEYLKGFFEDGSAPLDLGLDTVQGFAGEGIVPMFISGPWMINAIQSQAPDLEGKWAVAPLPAKKNNLSVLGGSNLAVFEYTKHPEEALAFIQYMSKKETQMKWNELTKSLPSNIAAWEAPLLKEDPKYQAIQEQLRHSEHMPMLVQWEKIAQTYLESFERIVRADADIQAELDAFNAKAEQILSE